MQTRTHFFGSSPGQPAGKENETAYGRPSVCRELAALTDKFSTGSDFWTGGWWGGRRGKDRGHVLCLRAKTLVSFVNTGIRAKEKPISRSIR